MSTAVEQEVACALVTQRARVRSPVGTGFLGEVFSGVFSPVRQMSGNFRPPRSPNIIWPSSSSFHIRLVGINGRVLGVYCLSCLCCFGGGPGIGLITHPGRPSMSLCGQKSMHVIHSLIPSPTGRGTVRLGRRGSRKGTYKGRLNLDNELRKEEIIVIKLNFSVTTCGPLSKRVCKTIAIEALCRE